MVVYWWMDVFFHCMFHWLADSALIYFSQNGSYLGPISGRNPSPVTSAVGFNENATLPFEPGKTYRLRIINLGAFAGFYFWIDGHEMQIIEADGVRLVLPASYNSVDSCYHRQTHSRNLSICWVCQWHSVTLCLSPRGTIRRRTGPSTRTWIQACLTRFPVL